MGIDDTQVERLLDRVRREVDEGLLPSCQIALGLDGEIVVHEVFGDADLDTRYCIFSATKAFVAATFWQLISEGLVDVTQPVIAYVPEFGSLGKEAITVEQVMLHTSGFPHAPMGPPAWGSSASRRETFSAWRLNWEPGTRFEYHPTSAHWVLAGVNLRGPTRPPGFRSVMSPTVMTSTRSAGPGATQRLQASLRSARSRREWMSARVHSDGYGHLLTSARGC